MPSAMDNHIRFQTTSDDLYSDVSLLKCSGRWLPKHTIPQSLERPSWGDSREVDGSSVLGHGCISFLFLGPVGSLAVW